MIIPNLFDNFIISIPNNGLLHLGSYLCQQKELYNNIGITYDNILCVDANTDIINTKDNEYIFEL